MKVRHHLEDLGVDERILEWMLTKEGEKMWTGCIWFRTGTRDGLLLTQ
jgi:hypothetical protein